MTGSEGVLESLRCRGGFENCGLTLADFYDWNVHEIRPLVQQLNPCTLELKNSSLTRQIILSRIFRYLREHARNANRGIWKYLPPAIRHRYDSYFVDIPINWNSSSRETWGGDLVLAEFSCCYLPDHFVMYRHSDTLISYFDMSTQSQTFIDLSTRRSARLRSRFAETVAVIFTAKRAIAISHTRGVMLWRSDSNVPIKISQKPEPGLSFAHGRFGNITGFITLPESPTLARYFGFDESTVIDSTDPDITLTDGSRYPRIPCREYHRAKRARPGQIVIIDTTMWSIIEIFTRFAMFVTHQVNSRLEAIFRLLRRTRFIQAWPLIELYINDQPYSRQSIYRLLEEGTM